MRVRVGDRVGGRVGVRARARARVRVRVRVRVRGRVRVRVKVRVRGLRTVGRDAPGREAGRTVALGSWDDHLEWCCGGLGSGLGSG